MRKRNNCLLATALVLSSLTLSSVVYAGTITSNTTISGNVSSHQNEGSTGNYNRGGAYNINDPNAPEGERSPLEVTISNAVLENNSVTGNGYGGVVFVGDGTLNVINSTFRGNHASWDGGAISSASPYYRDNASSGPKLVISNSLFESNTADIYSGGAIGLYSEAVINNTKFYNNNAGGHNPSESTDGGGAIYIGGWGQATINNSEFVGNSSNKGGAIATTGAGLGTSHYFNINNSIFENNTATEQGGAIYTQFTKDSEGHSSSITGSSFNNNSAGKHGGAISAVAELEITGSNFSNNHSGEDGGAVYSTADLTINGSTFTNNYTLYEGGAVKQKGDNLTLNINNSIFTSNYNTHERYGYGGAVYTQGDITGTITNTVFDGNTAARRGGAVMVGTGVTMDFSNTSFTNNIVNANEEYDSNGGAIYVGESTDVTISSSSFENNMSGEGGGAVYQQNNSNSLTIKDSLFKNNQTVSEGGALWLGNKSTVENTIFEGNKTTGTKISGTPDYENDNEGGGAIFVGSSANAAITGSSFINNESGTRGGAIATRSNASSDNSTLSVESSDFSGNKAATDGGAIASFIDVNVKNTNFVNNTAGKNGGAIWANDNVTITAQDQNVVFSGNSAADGGDIYMATAGKELNFNITSESEDQNTITIGSGISGAGKYTLNINGDGMLDLQSYIKNANINVNDVATLWLNNGSDITENTQITMNDGTELITINNQIDTFGDNLITINGDVGLGVDVDLVSGKADNFGLINYGEDGKITLEGVKPTNSNTTKDNFSFNIYDATGLDKSRVTIDDQFVAMDTLTPIRYLKGAIDENGLITYGPRGDGWKDFNPSVFTSPVAAQLGGYLVQLNSYDQAFMNLDMKMLMTQEERKAMKMRNSYAAAGTSSSAPMVYSPTYLPEKESAGWVRPYATFENVGLNGGPRVSNVMYGTFFGADSEMYEFDNGAEAQFSVYAGYNGSHQAFTGNSLWQNGGTLGLTGIVYKGNFFTALTANAGASVVDASTMYGNEDFPMLMAGVASKTGYNWELAKGKFIIQPNYLMSYTFVNTFDYTNAAGVRIKSDPLNAINIAPGVKLIGNLKNGWQPYINLRMVWNIMDKTDFMAANTSIPDLSVKPYFEYGLGVQKRWGDRFTGFGQIMFRNGGRNGVSMGFGFRWALGKGSSSAYSLNSDKVVIKEPTKMKLSNIK